MTALVQKIAALDASDVRLLGRAFFALLRARVSLWTTPWPPTTVLDDRLVGAVGPRPNVHRLAWAIRAASRCVPRATCLTQALGLRRLLSDFGYVSVVQVGIQRTDDEFRAHAWVEHDGLPLLSGPADLARYTRLFAWPKSRPHVP